MGYLRGFNDYLSQNYNRDLFDEFKEKGIWLDFLLHGKRLVSGRILRNLKFDLLIKNEDREEFQIPKVYVKCFYLSKARVEASRAIKHDSEVEALKLKPILKPEKRYHIKNKTLYPLMIEREPVRITLLEGEVVRGIIEDFTRFDLIVKISDSLNVIVLRHAVYRFENERGRNLLKSFQDEQKDWEKSPLWIEERNNQEE